jgi:hypothetical protein
MKFIDTVLCFVSTWIVAMVAICHGYSLKHPQQQQPLDKVAATARTRIESLSLCLSCPEVFVSRQSFLAVVAGATACGTPVASWAKDTAKGTKDDPAFQACLSQCK